MILLTDYRAVWEYLNFIFSTYTVKYRFSATVLRLHRDFLYFGYHLKWQPSCVFDLYKNEWKYLHQVQIQRGNTIIILTCLKNTQTTFQLIIDWLRVRSSNFELWNRRQSTIKLIVLSVNIVIPLLPHGQIGVTHSLQLVLSMTLSEMDATLKHQDTNK